MADTQVQLQAESWVVTNELPRMFSQVFSKAKLKLSWGGEFEFDAVSDDSRIVACVSTSCCRTAGGRPAVGKYHKIRSDVLYLINAIGPTRRVLVFTDPEMVKHFEAESSHGRFPPADQIELRLAELSEELREALGKARKDASDEVSPERRNLAEIQRSTEELTE
jgi:hypothetical protein